MPCSLPRNQVRVYNKSFGDFISTHHIHLANNGEINDHVALTNKTALMTFKCNQMMNSYFFLRDQSLEKWVKYIKKY